MALAHSRGPRLGLGCLCRRPSPPLHGRLRADFRPRPLVNRARCTLLGHLFIFLGDLVAEAGQTSPHFLGGLCDHSLVDGGGLNRRLPAYEALLLLLLRGVLHLDSLRLHRWSRSLVHETQPQLGSFGTVPRHLGEKRGQLSTSRLCGRLYDRSSRTPSIQRTCSHWQAHGHPGAISDGEIGRAHV